MGATGAIFLGLSGYALVSRKDFSFMGGFLMVGFLLIFCTPLFNKDNHTENNSLTSATCCPTTGVHF
jgi:FtsH-binding integral membrane protein